MPDYNFISAQDLQHTLAYGIPRRAFKPITAAASQLTTGLSPVTLFTVQGLVIARIFATVETALTSTSSTGTLAIGVTGATGAFIAATTADGTNFPINSVWSGDTSPTLRAEVFSGTALNWAPVNNTNIIATIATNSMTAGAITFYCQWIPMTTTSSVVAA